MNIYQCEKYAQKNGFDSVKFIADFPSGPKECKWLDAYFGMFEVSGIDGFIRTGDIDDMFPELSCRLVEVEA